MLIRKLLCASLMIAVPLLHSGCATLFSDSADEVHLESEPSGAQVFLHGRFLGRTPIRSSIPRQSEPNALVFKKEGYAPKTVDLQRGVAGAAFLNLIFITTTFGVTSWGIDFASGKMFKYSPQSYVVDLQKHGASNSTERSLEYAIQNFETLRNEIARGEVKTLKGLCSARDLNAEGCDQLLKNIASDKNSLVKQPDGLALYRELFNQPA